MIRKFLKNVIKFCRKWIVSNVGLADQEMVSKKDQLSFFKDTYLSLHAFKEGLNFIQFTTIFFNRIQSCSRTNLL